jgi:hypothetical protein
VCYKSIDTRCGLAVTSAVAGIHPQEFSVPPTPKMPATDAVIRVLRQDGGKSHMTTVSDARELIRGGTVDRIGRNCIQYRQGPSRPVAGTKYTYASESKTNVQGVVTFRPILHHPREMYRAVQTSVLVTG